MLFVSTKTMHPSFARLLEVAAKSGVSEKDIPVELGKTPASVGMWRYRGVSHRGAIEIAKRFGCSAEYITDGAGHPTASSAPAIQMSSIEYALSEITDKQTRYRAWSAALNAIAQFAPAQTSPPDHTPMPPATAGKQRASRQP